MSVNSTPKRRLYGGYGLTELRRYAREHRIPNRSRMNGDELLDAVRAAWDSNRQAKEDVVLAAGPVGIGTRLRFATHPGCTIVATSDVRRHEQHGALYVLAEYTGLCDVCGKNTPAGLEYLNRAARGELFEGSDPYRFYLYSLEHEPVREPSEPDADMTRVGVIVDAAGDPTADLIYLAALEAWRRGDLPAARVALAYAEFYATPTDVPAPTVGPVAAVWRAIWRAAENGCLGCGRTGGRHFSSCPNRDRGTRAVLSLVRDGLITLVREDVAFAESDDIGWARSVNSVNP